MFALDKVFEALFLEYLLNVCSFSAADPSHSLE